MNPRRILLALTVALVPACGDPGGSGALLGSPVLEGATTQDIAVGNAPACLVVADLNNDTHLDVVVGTLGGVFFIRGSASGSMNAAQSPAGGSLLAASSVAVGLLNNDVLPDLVVGLQGSSDVEVYLNTGNGTTPYNTFTNYPVATGPVGGLALADVDDDGDLDVVTANPDAHSVSVLANNGAGVLGAAAHSAAGLGARFVASADFNGDGLPDLVTANELGDSLSILIGSGTVPAFGAPTFLPTGDQPRCVALADFNSDGLTDLAAVCFVSSELLVFPGRANGTFGIPISTTVSTGHAWVAAGDASEDGRADLMIVGVNLFNPIFLAGRGNGGFLPFEVVNNMGNPVTVNGHQSSGAMADLNQDGLLDLILAFGAFGSSTVTVRITATVTP